MQVNANNYQQQLFKELFNLLKTKIKQQGNNVKLLTGQAYKIPVTQTFSWFTSNGP